MAVQILSINPNNSDGDGRKWPKHAYVRNDAYFLERVATDKWIKDLGGQQPGVTYRLDQLPRGYGGFERTRPGTSHVDRYVYGHPRGQFRSLNEFYPHFKHLMDTGGPFGCSCKLCAHGTSRVKTEGKPATSLARKPKQPVRNAGRPLEDLPSESPAVRKTVDNEGTPDVYEIMINKLKIAEEKGTDLAIEEYSSPDWRTANLSLKRVIRAIRQYARYVPRIGELVLFVRKLQGGESIAWNPNTQAFHRMDAAAKTWLGPPIWEVGTVTQMPEEEVTDDDLAGDAAKVRNVNYSGWRVEPLAQPGNPHKPSTTQHKYLPLHALRPFFVWKECLNGVPEPDWHPSIRHALTIGRSFNIQGRYRFKGVWPNATVFAQAIYTGAEFLTVGDTVRLMPRPLEQRSDTVTDVMYITAIRVRLVNMDIGEDTESLQPTPYQTCLHLSGHIYTRDPTRSHDGPGATPLPASDLPEGLPGYGPWYPYNPAKIEIPYTRVLGRCPEHAALAAWFTPPDIPAPASFQAVNAAPTLAGAETDALSRGLAAITHAREYSLKHDMRIEAGRSWFWADSRIEQLDLHEVNSRSVGVKNSARNRAVRDLGKELKALDGRKGGVEEFNAVRREQEAEERRRAEKSVSGAVGLVAGSAHGSGGELDRVDGGDPMDVDEGGDAEAQDVEKTEMIILDDSDEDELARDTGVGELAKNFRSNNGARVKGAAERD